MNLKTRSEELVEVMNNSHDAAEQATKDVKEIQSKIDELNKSLKDAGVKKIEDIVDPAERERLQAINDMLQAQLELKKQLEKDANNKANADSFSQYKDEYVAGTNAMTAATKALVNAQDNTGIDTTNLDIFSEKIKQIKNDIDNGDSQQSDWKTFNGLDAFSGMTGEAIINIDSDTAHQTEAEATALAKLHEIADANNISFEDLIGAFEQLGIVATSDTSGIANYATQLEETMKDIDRLQSSYKSCSSAVEEYNKYGYLSTDTMQSLLQMDTEYLNCLDLKDGKLQINKQRYAELLAAQYAQTEMEAIEQAITELNTIAKEDSAEKTESLTTATEEEKNKLVALCPALKDATTGTGELAAALAAAQGAANGDNADEVQAKIDSVMNALNTKLTLLHDNMSAAINNGNALSNQLGGFSNSTKSASKSVSDAASAFDTLSKAMKEYNQYGYICADTMKSLAGLEDKYTMQNLMALPDEFSSLLGYDEGGNAKLDVKTLRDNYVKQLKKLAKDFKGKPIGIQAEAAIEDVREPTPEEYEKLAKKTLTYQKALARYTRKISKINSNKDLTEDEALQQKAEAQAELDGALQESLLEVQETDKQVTIKLEKHWDGVKKVVEKFKSALSDVKDIFSSFLDLIESANSKKDSDLKLWGEAMTEDIDKRIDALNEQKEALEKANDEEERAITLAKLQAELEKARTQRSVHKLTSNGYEWVADESAVKEAQDNLNDQQREWNQKDAEEAIDNQIDKLNELKDKYSEIINLIGTDLDDYIDYTEVKNCVEVFGASVNYDTYVDNEHMVISSASESGNDSSDTMSITLRTTSLDTSQECMIAFTTPITGLLKHVNITIVNSVTETDGNNNTSIKEYTHGPYKLYATDVDEKGSDVEMDGTIIASDMMIVVQYSPTYKKFYYRGEQQTHAMAFLVSKMPTEKEIAQAKETEACNNIKYICLTDDNVNLNTQANPRFTIEKIGRRNKVCSGSEFEMYTTDESTMQCTEYML